MSWAEIEKRHAEATVHRKAKELSAAERALPLRERPSMQALIAPLSEGERAVFWSLLDDYKASCLFLHGRSLVDAKVILELVKLGWRKP